MSPASENSHTVAKRWSTVVVLLVVAAMMIIRLTTTRKHLNHTTAGTPQIAQQGEVDVLHFTQTALDRSIEALTHNPEWRDGFHREAIENGTYDVTVFDGTDDGNGVYDPSVPSNCVRIVATSQLNGVTRKVEAIWVNALAAFDRAVSAGNAIRIDGSNHADCIIVGDIHNNAWRDGETSITGSSTIYGCVTSTGEILIGTPTAPGPSVVFGSIGGTTITIGSYGEIRDFEDLSEWSEGVDLDRDGDHDDLYVTKTSARVEAAESVTAAGLSLSNGDTDLRVADGTQSVVVGRPPPGRIVDPRLDFAAYYELVTGTSTYPPPDEYTFTDIPGDGDGHYFPSAGRFLEWINAQRQTYALCWRCAGDGRVDPDNSSECPSCEATGSTAAVEITGVFYVDDDALDLGITETNLIVHGTIIVAQGNPRQWPEKTVDTPGGTMTIDHSPDRGRLILGGPTRMHFTMTHRARRDGGRYAWQHKQIGNGVDEQSIAIPEPVDAGAMREFPSLIAAEAIHIQPRTVGFAQHAGDIGDEVMTILQGVIVTEGMIHIDGHGGWSGDPVVFDEAESRGGNDVFDETVLRVDLNGDGDVLDRVKTVDVTGCPAIRVSKDRYTVDINNDGVLGRIVLGRDYQEFFLENGFTPPVLVYHEGTLLAETIHVGGGHVTLFDPSITDSGPPFGFRIDHATETKWGLLSWREVPPN